MKISPKRFVEMRHEEFRSRALPALMSIGFQMCPMGKPYWGSEPHGGFQYDLCRLRTDCILELLTVYIIKRRNRRFQIEYNQVEIPSTVGDLRELKNVDDMPFRIPPVSETTMEIPPVRWIGEPCWPPQYKIPLWRLWFGVGIQNSVKNEITRMIGDLENFERFVKHWEETKNRVKLDLDPQ